jgi:tetratricopeptide (TPR) repeat protein
MSVASGERIQGWVSIARAPALVACVALALYLPSLAFSLVWDDPILLQFLHERMHAGGLGAVLSSEFLPGSEVTHTGYFRPVILLSLLVDEGLGSGKPWAFHLTNIVLHALASGMAALLLRRLLHDGRSAAFGGLLFAAHPVHVESVAFVSGRTDLWAACFAFLATCLWVRERERGRKRASLFAWGGVTACLVLGTLSKEVAMMVVPVWLVWDLLDRDGRPASWIRRNGAWLAATLAAVVIVVALRMGTVGLWPGAAATSSAPFGARGPTSWELLLPRLITYARLLVIPWPLNSYYTVDEIHLGPGVAVGALLAGSMFALAARGDDRRPGVASLTWTLFLLVPVLGVATVAGAPVAERFLYIPSFGACLAAATLWRRLSRRSTLAAMTTGGAALLLFSAATVLRTPVWKDEIALYTDMARTSPRAFGAHFNLGNELIKAKRPAEAEVSLSRAVELAPERADAWTSLGLARAMLGRNSEAERAFDEAVRLRPDLIVALKNRAWALARAGRSDDAVRAFTDWLVRAPDEIEAYMGRYDALAKQGEWQEALESLRGWPEASSGDRLLLMRRALALLRLHRPAEALTTLEGARGLVPGDARLLIEIGQTLSNTGRSEEANRAFELANRVAPGSTEASR